MVSLFDKQRKIWDRSKKGFSRLVYSKFLSFDIEFLRKIKMSKRGQQTWVIVTIIIVVLFLLAMLVFYGMLGDKAGGLTDQIGGFF